MAEKRSKRRRRTKDNKNKEAVYASKQNKLPSLEEIVVFIQAQQAYSKRDVLRFFDIKSKDRTAFKALLSQAESLLQENGNSNRNKKPTQKSSDVSLPRVIRVKVISVTGKRLLAAPCDEQLDGVKFSLSMPSDIKVTVATHLLVLRQHKVAENTYGGKILKVLERLEPKSLIGFVEKSGKKLMLYSTDRRDTKPYQISETMAQDLRGGDLVEAIISAPPRGRILGKVSVTRKVGDISDPKLISLISILEADIPYKFPKAVLEEAEKCALPSLEGREDLRSTPLVTIDGEDARDFDDAVWAEESKSGFHIIVAIADVAHYVPIGSELDKEAYNRGNSVYFPDRVVPMLPEALSNGMCSLRPGEDRACLAVHLWIGKKGNLQRYRFTRALMCSHARLTYNEVQRITDTPTFDPKKWETIEPLIKAYKALKYARESRGTLELDLEERKIQFDKYGGIESVLPRERFESHKLIEEMMILANIAAARALQEKEMPSLYRVHEKPDEAKVEVLLNLLKSMGIQTKDRYTQNPAFFNQVLAKVDDHPAKLLIQEMVLRAQSQAVYQPGNIGHFGLSLEDYTHFTSPIRRYSDLIVHRSLIDCLSLGSDGWLEKPTEVLLAEIGAHISQTERRAMKAERNAMSRYVIAFMENKVGAQFEAHISGVTRGGLFIELDDTGAEGFLPQAYLPKDIYRTSEKKPILQGRYHSFMLGDAIYVQLEEANALTNGMIFSYISR